MYTYVTADDYTTSEHYNGDTKQMFGWDQHGGAIGYYPSNASSTYIEREGPDGQPDDYYKIDRNADGTPKIREEHGDVLCAACATRWLADNDDAVCTLAFQTLGQIDGKTTCDDCYGTIIDDDAESDDNADTAEPMDPPPHTGPVWYLAWMLD